MITGTNKQVMIKVEAQRKGIGCKSWVGS